MPFAYCRNRTKPTGSPSGAAFGLFQALDFQSGGTNPSGRSSEAMAKASKIRRPGIPEPSFDFFLRAIGVMLLLVVIMTAYFSLHT
jgi:hypothetical protein